MDKVYHGIFLWFAMIFIFFIGSFFTGMSAAGAELPDGAPPRAMLTESALVSGYGSGHVREGHYQPLLLIWQIGMDVERLFPKLKQWGGGRVYLFLEPQLNPVTGPETDFEVGLGMGIKYLYPLSERFSAYILAATGLQYISVVTEDQANGFNFSDLIGGGLYCFLSTHSALTAGYRFRHISNAGMIMPNGGINSQFLTVGYSVFF